MFAPTRRLLAVLPVSVAEFRESLASTWLPRVRVRSPRLGLAVSGGVDSMALATLCADLSEEIDEDGDAEVFTAFIVDHQLRKGSGEEVLEVQENLHQLGIASEILQIQWPEGTDTKALTNLETLARRFRFRLLGQACRDHGIESLLLAHHSDDQAETAMMRLVEGHRGMGLRGMRATGDIPECFGMHGVHQSHAEWIETGEYQPSPPSAQRAVDIEYWGIHVLRPLLPFSKARLNATCEASGTHWVEDETNKDPTLTMRNAVRHIYQNYRLPAAISKPALLLLTQRTADKIRQREQAVDNLVHSLDAVLDVRSGELAIRFSRNFYPPSTMRLTQATEHVHLGFQSRAPRSRRIYMSHPDPATKVFDIEEGKLTAAMLLRHLANLVSPRETVDLSSLETAVRHLFPRLYLHKPFDDLPDRVPASFTAAGVLFERVETPDDYFPYYTWIMSRQPYPRGENPTVIIPPSISFSSTTLLSSPTDISDDEIPFPTTNANDGPVTNETSPFILYDGRWWLRVHNPSPTGVPLTVRPFRHTDLKRLRAALAGPMRERFETLRTDSARNKARFTLPVITAPASSVPRSSSPLSDRHNSVEEEGEQGGERSGGQEGATTTAEGDVDDDIVIAVPTLGVKINVGDAARVWQGLRWDVRYKKLDASVKVRDAWVEYPTTAEEEAMPDEDVPFVVDEQQ